MRRLTSLLVIIIVAACSSNAPTGPSPSPFTLACEARVERGVLPAWARAGFSDAEPIMPHVISRSGEFAAILFGDPLTSPPSPSHNNKILWVAGPKSGSAPARPSASPGPTDLQISAQRMVGATPIGEPVERRVKGGPSPSIVDLPEAGCWRLSLTWADRTDSLDLEYVSPD
jgi:hypothetical protein